MRALRTRLRMSQADLAEALDMSRDRIVRFETGKARIPQVVALACAAINALRIGIYADAPLRLIKGNYIDDSLKEGLSE